MSDWKEYIDIDSALNRVRGNKKLYRRMLGMFLDSTEFGALDAAITANDYPRAAEVAHGIKGMTGNLSLGPLFDSSVDLMAKFREGVADSAAIELYRKNLEETKKAIAACITELDAELNPQ